MRETEAQGVQTPMLASSTMRGWIQLGSEAHAHGVNLRPASHPAHNPYFLPVLPTTSAFRRLYLPSHYLSSFFIFYSVIFLDGRVLPLQNTNLITFPLSIKSFMLPCCFPGRMQAQPLRPDLDFTPHHCVLYSTPCPPTPAKTAIPPLSEVQGFTF